METKLVMKSTAGWSVRALAFLCLPLAWTLHAQSPVVFEHRMDNGARALLAPRPGSGAIHAAWFFGGRDRAAEGLETLLAAWHFGSDAQRASSFWTMPILGGVAGGRDIAADGLEDWCRTELRRVTAPLDQEQYNGALRRRKGPNPLTELKAFALNAEYVSEPPEVSLERLRAIAKDRISPEGSLVVLVGDFDVGGATKTLNASFGLLPRPSEPADGHGGIGGTETKGEQISETTEYFEYTDDSEPEPPKKVIPSKKNSEALVAWKTPPSCDPDALELFAELLVGSPSSGLRNHLVNTLGCSSSVTITLEPLWEPTTGHSTLFVVHADVHDSHTAQEVKNTIYDQVLRALERGWSELEMSHAGHRLETLRASRLADAPGLAHALIGTLATTSNWRTALRQVPFNVHPDWMETALASVFVPENALALMVEQDPIKSLKNQEHARMVAILTRRMENSAADAGQREYLVREALRQFALMPAALRRNTLSLLEAEVGR